MPQVPPAPPPLPTQEVPKAPLIPAWDFLRRNRHVTVPLAVPGLMAWAGETLTLLPQSATPTAVGAAATSAAVWWAAPHKWDRASEQWYARLSAIAAGAWLAAVAKYGLHAPEVAALGPGALAWGIPWWWHKRPHSRKRASLVASWDAWWCHYAYGWNLAGSTVYDVTTDGVIDTLAVQLNPGKQTLKQVREALPLIESALQGHVEDGRTRVERVPGNPSCVRVHLKRENPLDEDVEWDDSVAPRSVLDPAPIGRDDTGNWVHASLLDNWFVIGRRRSGKSNELSVMFASLINCYDAQPPWLIDLKGGRSGRPWAQAADWVAITIEEARLMLGLAKAEVRARALHAYDGNEQLIPTVEVPALTVVVDEAHGVLSPMAGDTQCNRLATAVTAEGGAVNVSTWVFTQYGGLHESVGTEQIRGNLPCRMCFAVAQADHGQFALSDWANLDASRLENKGEFYWKAGPDSPSAPARGQRMDHDVVREIAAAHPATERLPLVLYCGADPSPIEGMTWQQVYDTRWERVPEEFRPGYAPPAKRAPKEAAVTDPTETFAETMARIEEEVASLPDLAAPPRVDPALLADELTRRRKLFADLITAAPAGGISPKQLHAGTALSTSWIHLRLRALIDKGAVTKLTTGRYGPVAGQDVWKAVQAVDADLAQLAAAARDKVSA